MSDAKRQPDPQPTQHDFEVARRVASLYWSDYQPGTQKYFETVNQSASSRARGRDFFDIRHLLREPRTRYERVYLELAEGGKSNWAPKWNESGERPIDVEMLTDLYNEVDRKLQSYSQALVAIIGASTDQLDPDRREKDLPEIQRLWEDVGLRVSMHPAEITTVLDFLTLLQARHGRLVEVGDCSAPNAHELVMEFLDDANSLWESHLRIAQASQTDPKYLYSVHATELAYGAFTDDKARPRPKALQSAIKLEYLVARDVLEKSGLDAISSKVHVEQFSDQALKQLSRSPERSEEIWVHSGDLGTKLYNRARQAHGPGRKSTVRREYIDGQLHFLLQDIAKLWWNDLPLYLRRRLPRSRGSGAK